MSSPYFKIKSKLHPVAYQVLQVVSCLPLASRSLRLPAQYPLLPQSSHYSANMPHLLLPQVCILVLPSTWRCYGSHFCMSNFLISNISGQISPTQERQFLKNVANTSLFPPPVMLNPIILLYFHHGSP